MIYLSISLLFSSVRCCCTRLGLIPFFHCYQKCLTHSMGPGPGCSTDNVPDRASAQVAPVGCQLATMAPTINTGTVPKGGLHGITCHPNLGRQGLWAELSPSLGRQGLWAELHETGGLSAALVVNRLRRCRATRPWLADPPVSLCLVSAVHDGPGS